MPRIHDFDRDPSRSDEDYIWSIFRDRRQGRGELSEIDLWGPQAIFHFDGLHHQFRLKTPEGTSPYVNALVNPAYRWLEENMSGPWHWLEGQTNNYRSVYTAVYIQDDADIEAFNASWSALFKYDEDYTCDNAKWLAMDRDARERGVMPEYVRASSMHHILMGMAVSDTTADWLDGFKNRGGFDDLAVEGLERAVAHFLKAEPSEYGAKLPGGQWNKKLVEAFVAVGEWIRGKAPETLRERLQDFEIGDKILSEAFGPLGDATAAHP
jgi:hypothetical protein